ncbi:MAG: hypothetical protein K9M36_01350 [Candidatus Pacebacteria bacterium]|nr:hypothetical protein [Candidatus Paceibacterota bacterium]
MHEGLPNKKNPENSPVPPGCDEKYFWKIVAHISGDFGDSKHLYKSRDGLDVQSYHKQSVDKYGDYIPHMEKYIKEAQQIILDPNSPVHKLFSQVEKGIFDTKRGIIERVQGEEIDPTQPFIDLDDDLDNELKGGSRVD